MPLFCIVSIIDVALGLVLFFLSTLFKMDLSDFTRGFCTGVAGVLTLGGAAFLVWHFIRKKKTIIPKIDIPLKKQMSPYGYN